MTKCCKTCVFCNYIKSPSITGNPIDFVCRKKGAVIEDIEVKCCDAMYEPRQKVKGSNECIDKVRQMQQNNPSG